MKVKAPPRMSSIQWFVSIAAGLAMFLLPQDAQSYFSDVYRQIFVAVVAFGIALVLLLLFKLYEPIGVAMLSSMFLTVITFAIRIGRYKSQRRFAAGVFAGVYCDYAGQLGSLQPYFQSRETMLNQAKLSKGS